MPMLTALIILDGWGIAPASDSNAISLAQTPNLDSLKSAYAYTELTASGESVGLPPGQDGNSEAGHMNIGAGRIVEQEATYINRQISMGRFFKNPAFLEAAHHVKKHNGRLHIMGLLSNHMSAHSYPDHLEALLTFCNQKKIKPYFHLFTDGRDAPPHKAVHLLKQLQDKFFGNERIATVMGRFYGMERNKRWEVTEQAYNAMVLGEGEAADSAEEAITRSYNRDETDEFIKPHIIDSEGMIQDNDAVIFFNLRSDRARQISKAFVQKDFQARNPEAFKRKRIVDNLKFVSMTDFGPDLDDVLTAFPSRDLEETLPMQLKEYRQLYLSESEKYAHVTYFFNGSYKDPIAGEFREMIPSPDVDFYDQKPEMSSDQLTKKLKTVFRPETF